MSAVNNILDTLSTSDLAYLEGFIKACSDRGVDPEGLLVQAQGTRQGSKGSKEQSND